MNPNLAVICAGPIGLVAALYAAEFGYRVSVYEAERIGANHAGPGPRSDVLPMGVQHVGAGSRDTRAFCLREPKTRKDRS